MPVDVVPAEGIGILGAKQFVQSFTGIGQLLVPAGVQREIRQIENSLQVWHLVSLDDVYDIVTYKQ